MTKQVKLKRTLSLTQLVLYGLGTTIGAGIYALVGELAGISGYMAPSAFLLASLMAGLTALSFAELSGRFPKAAGASLYINQAFGSHKLSTIVGLLVFFGGVVSSAALINAFIGYLQQFIEIQRLTSILLICLIIGGLAAWGIAQSVFIAGFITLIEIGGLALIIFYSAPIFIELPARLPDLIPGSDLTHWSAIYAGALLAFYAFIGFEDMVDVAEEVNNVKRNLPIAIILTLSITTVIYMLIMLAAVLAIPPEQLAHEKAPLVALYSHFSDDDPIIIGLIGMLAIINGALIQTIMASRVLYGLGSRGHLHIAFSKVHSFTQTPLLATATAIISIFLFALFGKLSVLAESTSLIILCIFSLVNLALWRIKKRDPQPENTIIFPIWLPIAGFFVSSGFVLSQVVHFFS